jgi:hypothetical protein
MLTIKSLKINDVDRNTNVNTIIKSFEKYAVVSNITMREFDTRIGSKFKHVYINVEKWHDTTETKEFIELIHNGKARLNYSWHVQDNTKEKKEQLQISIDDTPLPMDEEPLPMDEEPLPMDEEPLPMDEEPLPMDEEYIYDDGVKLHRYEWKDVMSIIYGGRGIENF